MEKKIALRFPSRIRGISMLPVELRVPRSNLPSRNRWVVSSCVSTTRDEKCSLRALSEMESPETASPTRQAEETHITTSSSVRTMLFPQSSARVKPLMVTETTLECQVPNRQASQEAPASTRYGLLPRWTPSKECPWDKRARSFAHSRTPECRRAP